MSRVELDAIQDKLKTAIQNHQMLVKTKGDKQNVAFKSSLSNLQEEIKRLSEEQKKIVVRLRESLVKSTSQPAQPQPSVISQMLTLDQTATGIGQTRLVSYPTQGGATILPVGMVAVPLAHVQRPALGVTFSAGRGQICTPANITIQPGDYASAVAAAAAQLPTGLHGSSISIPINSMNNNNNNIALQNSIAINNITNAINVSNLNSGIVNGSINITGLNNTPNINNLNTIIGSGVTGQPIGNIVIGSKAITQLNNNIPTSVFNSQIVNVTPSESTIKQLNILTTSSGSCLSSSNIVTANGSLPEPVAAPSTPCSTTCSTSHLSTVPTVAKNQLPLVQQQQQQQQPQMEMISFPQPSQQQQRLASNFPIKVPQYTASPIRTNASSTNVQFCSIAPAPGPTLPTPANCLSMGPALTTTCTSKKLEAAKPVSTLNIKSFDGKMPKAESMSQQLQKRTVQSPIKSLSLEEDKKHHFMKTLDLYTPEMLKDLLHKRNERKRRTTANPQYSVGFASHRWHRKETFPGANPFKKAKVVKERKPSTKASQSENIEKSDKMSDNHDDFCAACGKGGQLLMCETCRLVYHLDCLRPPLTEAPKYAWSCPKCLVSGKGSANLSDEALSRVHAYIGKRIAKEDERKKLQRKGAEIRNEKSFLDSRSKKLETEMKDQHESKKKMEAKEQGSKKELNQLSELVKSVRANHSTILSPSSKMGLKPSIGLSTTAVKPSSPLTPSLCIPRTINESSHKNSAGFVGKELNINRVDASKESVIGEDRVLLQFSLSSKQISDTESRSLKNGTETVDSVTVNPLRTNCTSHAPSMSLENVISSSIASSTSLPLSSSSSSSLTVTACEDPWPQPVIISENHLSVSS